MDSADEAEATGATRSLDEAKRNPGILPYGQLSPCPFRERPTSSPSPSATGEPITLPPMLLRAVLRTVRRQRPFVITAVVVPPPGHIHAMWSCRRTTPIIRPLA